MSRQNSTTASKSSEAYARAALDLACAAIVSALNGAQEATLHRECFSIGGLVAGGALEHGEALARLVDAARRMPVYGERWSGVERKVGASLSRGMASPRSVPEGRGRAAHPAVNARATARRDACEPRSKATTTADALAMWREADDPHHIAPFLYFVSRKLELDHDLCGRVLRWHEHDRALVALFRNILTDAPQAVSRTFINDDGNKIERRFYGPNGGAAIKLDPDDSVTVGLFVGEGVETCLSARQLGMSPVWALGSATAIETLPVLDGVETLTILAEHCERNARAIETCGERWTAAGREVLINYPLVGKDLNDVLCAKSINGTIRRYCPDQKATRKVITPLRVASFNKDMIEGSNHA
jgi:hypothetical protein